MSEEFRRKLQRIAKSFLALQREKEERFKRLHEAVVGNEARRIAFENMHFMEDKQWVQVDDILKLLEENVVASCLNCDWDGSIEKLERVNAPTDKQIKFLHCPSCGGEDFVLYRKEGST